MNYDWQLAESILDDLLNTVQLFRRNILHQDSIMHKKKRSGSGNASQFWRKNSNPQHNIVLPNYSPPLLSSGN